MRSAHRARPCTSAGTRLLVPAVVLLVGLGAAGCRSGERTEDRAGELLSGPRQAPTLAVEPVSRLGHVTGTLSRGEARVVKERVSRIVVRWLHDAYVEGRYPRTRFDGAFADFSRGARAAARADSRVMTNAAIGPRTRAVTPSRMAVEVDLLAVDRRAVGATARMLTTFRTRGRAQGHHRVSGRLLLSRHDGRWTVFGYHVARGER